MFYALGVRFYFHALPPSLSLSLSAFISIFTLSKVNLIKMYMYVMLQHFVIFRAKADKEVIWRVWKVRRPIASVESNEKNNKLKVEQTLFGGIKLNSLCSHLIRHVSKTFNNLRLHFKILVNKTLFINATVSTRVYQSNVIVFCAYSLLTCFKISLTFVLL